MHALAGAEDVALPRTPRTSATTAPFGDTGLPFMCVLAPGKAVGTVSKAGPPDLLAAPIADILWSQTPVPLMVPLCRNVRPPLSQAPGKTRSFVLIDRL